MFVRVSEVEEGIGLEGGGGRRGVGRCVRSASPHICVKVENVGQEESRLCIFFFYFYASLN